MARATAAGEAAVAVVRLSGPDTRHILGRLFRPKFGAKSAAGNHLQPWRLYLGELINPEPDPARGQAIDECLAVFMPAPRSYTGEDVGELHLHGGRAISERALELACELGARLAEPGEFTRRAYLAGRLDLAQAEAVCELVRSRTAAAARLAAAQLQGGLSRRIEALRQALADMVASAEAAIDFPEEEVELVAPQEEAAAIRRGPLRLVEELLAAGRAAEMVREGAQVTICGRPNVGKSTLLNALLGRERALTSPQPGTTRDFIEEALEVRGVPVRLIDTAGLREQAQGVEAAGVALAEAKLASCDLALAVLDASLPLAPEDAALARRVRAHPHLAVLNKADLPAQVSPEEARRLFPEAAALLSISALRGDGVDDLRARLASLLAPEALPEVAPGARHQDALRRARGSLERALEALEGGTGVEIYAAELRGALSALGEVCGQTATEEILERIFSRFCIGK